MLFWKYQHLVEWLPPPLHTAKISPNCDSKNHQLEDQEDQSFQYFIHGRDIVRKWKTRVEFSNNWLLAEFVLSAARVAPEGVGRAVAVEESKKKVSWVLWSRSRFGWVLTTSPNEARYLENCSSVSLTSNTSHSNRHWGKNRGLYSSLSSYIHT